MRRWVEDPLVEVTISLFTGYAAYIPAEQVGVSGVLAVVAAGIYLGRYSPEMTAPRNRLQSFEVWEMLPFLLNPVLFILIGLQLPGILDGISGEYPTTAVLLYAALVVLAVIGTRVLWTFPMAYLPRLFSSRRRASRPTRREVAVVAYTGMRGAISLAAALAIPMTTRGGDPFPGRDLILFITFSFILITLVPQGLSLPFIISLLGLEGEKGDEEREETEARRTRGRGLGARRDGRPDARPLRVPPRPLRRPLRRATPGWPEDYEDRTLAFQRFRRELLGAERKALLQLRNERRLSDEVRRRIERDLDLEDARLETRRSTRALTCRHEVLEPGARGRAGAPSGPAGSERPPE